MSIGGELTYHRLFGEGFTANEEEIGGGDVTTFNAVVRASSDEHGQRRSRLRRNLPSNEKIDIWMVEIGQAQPTTRRRSPMKYACLIYFDPKKAFDGSPEAESVICDSMNQDLEMRKGGHVVYEAPLQLPEQAITLTVRDGKMSTTDGPFVEAREMLGGIVVLEARDLNDAVRIAATIPHARLGSVEVRPFVDFSKPRPKL